MPDLDTPEIDEAPGAELDFGAPSSAPTTAPPAGFDKWLGALGLTKPDTTRSDALLVRDLQLGQERRAGLETMAARRRTEATDMGRTADTMAAERAAAKPAPLTLPEAPKPQPRAFAEPAPDASLLSQLHAVVLGAGQIAQQMAALKGANILGMTAIKGAMEGWQAGDTERANREIQTWQRSVEKLLAEHNDRTAAYKRLLEDHSLTWSQRFSLSRLQAEADQFQDMAVASEQQDIGKLLQATMRSEQAGATLQQNFGKVLLQLKQREAELMEKQRAHDLQNKQFELQLAQTAFNQAENRDQKEREGQRMEALRRDIVNLQAATSRAIAEGHDRTRIDVAHLMSADRERREAERRAEKYEPQELSITNSLVHLDRVEAAIGTLEKHKALANNDSWPERRRVDYLINTTSGETGNQISSALNTLKREGTALVVGAERTLGQTAATMRLKSVVEAEVGNLPYTPKTFWDGFLPTLRSQFNDQLALTRKRLGAAGEAAPANTPVALPKGSHREGADIVSDSGKYVWRGGAWQPR